MELKLHDNDNALQCQNELEMIEELIYVKKWVKTHKGIFQGKD